MTAVLLVWLALALGMAALWARQRQTGNAGLVDAGWALGTAFAGIGLCASFASHPGRATMAAAFIALWGGRLGLYIARRVLAEKKEDGRYATLRTRWGTNAQRNFFIFFQVQALLALVFAMPATLAASNASVFPRTTDLLAAVVWIVAVLGEGLADRQLSAFRNNPAHRGKVCDRGLWRYSRHPNYFFEWVHWFSYVLLAWGSPWWMLTFIGPVAMFLFLYRVTGIPATEAHALVSRGDAYRRYQQTTSPFFPWFPRASSNDTPPSPRSP